jgi:hypothetical protein
MWLLLLLLLLQCTRHSRRPAFYVCWGVALAHQRHRLPPPCPLAAQPQALLQASQAPPHVLEWCPARAAQALLLLLAALLLVTLLLLLLLLLGTLLLLLLLGTLLLLLLLLLLRVTLLLLLLVTLRVTLLLLPPWVLAPPPSWHPGMGSEPAGA